MSTTTAHDPRTGYVLLCHTDPAGVLDRVRRVRASSPTARVLVRTSRPELLAPDDVLAAGAELLVSRTHVRWGTFSVVEASLEALAEARRRWRPARTVLVSGQDLPVRDLAAWEAEVAAEGADAVLTEDPRDNSYRHRRCWHPLPAPGPLAGRALHRAARATRGDRGVHLAGGTTWFAHHRCTAPPPLPYRKGSLWGTYGAAAVDRLLDAAQDRELTGWFARTLLPDESFAQSVLRSTPSLRVVTRATTTAVFPPEDPAHPRALTEADVAAVLGSGTPFARKVLPGTSDGFVRGVDAALAAGRPGVGPGVRP